MPTRPVRLTVVGAGPRSLVVLERALAHAQVSGRPCVITLVDPLSPGTGAHPVDLPDHLLLNTVCAQVTAFSDPMMVPRDAPVTEGPDLFRWARAQG
ncbi:MAG TPA: FAD/NAD(P)-binding protein, partial [Kineosporiaceae bacterium]